MSRSIPHRCEPCVDIGSYFGHLVFENQRPPKCKVHGKEITPVFSYLRREFKRSELARVLVALTEMPTKAATEENHATA